MTSVSSHYTTATLCDQLNLVVPPISKTARNTASKPKNITTSANDASYKEMIFEGSRNTSLFSIAGSLRARGMNRAGIHQTLAVVNRDQVNPPLPEEEVARIAESIMRYPPAANDIELRRSLNDVGNATRLVGMFGAEMRYIPERKSWMFWNNERWQLDYNNVKITECAKLTVQAMYMEALTVSDNDLAVAVVKFAGQSQHENRLSAMIKLASKDGSVVLSVTQLDANPMYLGVQNGVLDLATGRLIKNQPEFYLTKFSAVRFDRNAKCPTFLTFLGRIFDENKEIIAYLRRVMGYCLTGRTDAQVLFFFHGKGANGKSTLLNLIEKLLGIALAKQTPSDTLMVKRSSNASNDIARLQGVRVVISNEVEDGSWLSEVTIKQLTGGDTVTARFLYGEYFEFQPEFKIMIAGNHKPVIRGTDYGIWRRIEMITFPVIIPAEERDPLLIAKLEAELSGILNWAIKGCLEWQRDGLKSPKSVTASIEDYREEMDVLGHWITDACKLGPGFSEQANSLYQRYRGWAEWGGFKPMTLTSFGRHLGERGFEKKRTAQGMIYQGLTLKLRPIMGV